MDGLVLNVQVLKSAFKCYCLLPTCTFVLGPGHTPLCRLVNGRRMEDGGGGENQVAEQFFTLYCTRGAFPHVYNHCSLAA